MNDTTVILFICGIVVSTVFSIISFLIKARLAKIDEDLTDLKHKYVELWRDMNEFKDNYLDRFEKVNQGIVDSKLEIINKIHALEMHMKR